MAHIFRKLPWNLPYDLSLQTSWPVPTQSWKTRYGKSLDAITHAEGEIKNAVYAALCSPAIKCSSNTLLPSRGHMRQSVIQQTLCRRVFEGELC
jgi:hypothetical protein